MGASSRSTGFRKDSTVGDGIPAAAPAFAAGHSATAGQSPVTVETAPFGHPHHGRPVISVGSRVVGWALTLTEAEGFADVLRGSPALAAALAEPDDYIDDPSSDWSLQRTPRPACPNGSAGVAVPRSTSGSERGASLPERRPS